MGLSGGKGNSRADTQSSSSTVNSQTTSNYVDNRVYQSDMGAIDAAVQLVRESLFFGDSATNGAFNDQSQVTVVDLPCPADIIEDNAVNVSDLLAVISAWGPCYPCAADVNRDSQVNVTDLLAVIGAWGACP